VGGKGQIFKMFCVFVYFRVNGLTECLELNKLLSARNGAFSTQLTMTASVAENIYLLALPKFKLRLF